MPNKRESLSKKQGPRKAVKGLSSLTRASLLYSELHQAGTASKPIKITADFDTALDALIAVPSPKKRRKSGRP